MAGSLGTTTPDNLINSAINIATRSITLISGQNLTRGALLGKITASGKYNLSLSAAGDGSETPIAVLAEDMDASAGDKTTLAYFKGGFNDRAMTFGTGHTADSVRQALGEKGIFLKNASPA